MIRHRTGDREHRLNDVQAIHQERVGSRALILSREFCGQFAIRARVIGLAQAASVDELPRVPETSRLHQQEIAVEAENSLRAIEVVNGACRAARGTWIVPMPARLRIAPKHLAYLRRQ